MGAEDEIYRRQIYALTDWIHEGVHFALISFYENIPKPGAPYDRRPNHHKRYEHDIVNFYIGTTRGNAMWDLTWGVRRKAVRPPWSGRQLRQGHGIFPASQIVTHNDRHWVCTTTVFANATVSPTAARTASAWPPSSATASSASRLQGGARDDFDQALQARVQPTTGQRAGRQHSCGGARQNRPDTHTVESDKLDALRWEPCWQDDRDLGSAKAKSSNCGSFEKRPPVSLSSDQPTATMNCP